MSILDEVQKEVEQLSPDQLKARFAEVMAEEAKRKERQKAYHAKTNTPEMKAKRQEYNKKRNSDPAVKEKRKAYMSSRKDKMKEYRTKRNAEVKAILAAAKAAGITLESATS